MPYQTYLVYGYVYDSFGNLIQDAKLEVVTSVSKTYHITDSDGIFLYDLADNGYVFEETVQINITEPYNNHYKNHTFVVSGDYKNENITLVLRTEAVLVTDYAPRAVLHSIGKKPITENNPLPVRIVYNQEVDLLNNPSWAWSVTDSDGQPDYEEVTLANGDVYRRTFSYTTVSGSRILTSRTKWVRQ